MKRTLAILNALANETRLHILLTLLQEDLCVCELQEILGVKQSHLSHQLRILRYLGLVEPKQEGRWVVYSVREEIRKNRIIQSIKESVKLSPGEKEKIFRIKMSSLRPAKESTISHGDMK